MWCEAVKLPKDPFNLRLLSVQEKGFLDQEYTTARSIWDVRNVLLRVTDATHSLISFQRSKKLFICWVKSPTNSLRNLWEQHKDVNSQSLLMGGLSLLWHVQCASVTPPHLHFNLTTIWSKLFCGIPSFPQRRSSSQWHQLLSMMFTSTWYFCSYFCELNGWREAAVTEPVKHA